MLLQYNLFFYLGVILFVIHLLLYGFGIDISFFGLLLMYIGWNKTVLYNWFLWFLWFCICLEIYSNYTIIRDRIIELPKKNIFNPLHE